MIPPFKTPYKISKPTILKTSTASSNNNKHLLIKSANDIFSRAKLSLRLKQEFQHSRNPQERAATLTTPSKPSHVISPYSTVSRSTSTLPIKHKQTFTCIVPSQHIPSFYLRSLSPIDRLHTISRELSNILRKLENRPPLLQRHQTVKANRTQRIRSISKRKHHNYPTLDRAIKRPFL